MEDLDRRIREALQDGVREDFDALAEQSLPRAMFESLRGKNSRLMIVGILFTFLMMAFAVYAGIQFVAAESIRELLAWSLGLIFCLFGISMMKIWCWMELNRVAIMREVKRVEMQLVDLGNRLSESRAQP